MRRTLLAATFALVLCIAAAAHAHAGSHRLLGKYEVVGGYLVQKVRYSASAKAVTADECFYFVDDDSGTARVDYEADEGARVEITRANGVTSATEIPFSGTIKRSFARSERFEPGPETDSYACAGASPPSRAPLSTSFCGSHKIKSDRAIELTDLATPQGRMQIFGPLVSAKNDPFGFRCPSDDAYSTAVMPSIAEGDRPDFSKDQRVTLSGSEHDDSTEPITWPGAVARQGFQAASVKWKLVLKRVGR